MNEAQEETVKWYGHAHPEEHRTVGDRAWCLTCGEWCYQTAFCRCCTAPPDTQIAALERELVALREERDELRIDFDRLMRVADNRQARAEDAERRLNAVIEASSIAETGRLNAKRELAVLRPKASAEMVCRHYPDTACPLHNVHCQAPECMVPRNALAATAAEENTDASSTT